MHTVRQAFRRLLTQKFLSFVNIFGLAFGLSVVMLITLYVWDEIRFDHYLDDGSGIYKVEVSVTEPGQGVYREHILGGGIGTGLNADYPQLVEAATRVRRFGERAITIGDLSQNEELYRADPTFFEIFDLDYVAGSAATALPDLSSVAISRSTALRLFGREDALGEIIALYDGNLHIVGAVYEDFPRNTHFRPNFIFPNRPSVMDDVTTDAGWQRYAFSTYVKVAAGTSQQDLSAALADLIDRYREAPSPGTKPSDVSQLTPIPLDKVHFESAAPGAGNPTLLAGFVAVAVLILLIATFNFMSIGISQSLRRSREIAVRKVFGANRQNIIRLFFSETVITVLLSLLLAAAIVELSLPWFNAIVDETMSAAKGMDMLAVMLVLVVLVSLAAGVYPAAVMAKLRPATTLSGARASDIRFVKLGTWLMAFQFAIAIALMIGTLTIFQQIRFSEDGNLGYNKRDLVLIEGLANVDISPLAIKDRLVAQSGVVKATLVDQTPGGTFGWSDGITSIAGQTLADPIEVRGMYIDADFVSTFGVELLTGRNLSDSRSEDYAQRAGAEHRDAYNILVNESAVKLFGFASPEQALGQTVGDEHIRTIVGVVSDYQIGSSRDVVPPMYFSMNEDWYRTLAVRYGRDELALVTDEINNVWSSMAGDVPLRLSFVEDRIAGLYRSERVQGSLFAFFSSLAIVITGIGLVGLVSLNIRSRIKEVGLRKVLGANRVQITGRILWDFSKPLIAATLVAWPIAAYFTNAWLSEFSFRIEQGAAPFVLSTFIVACLVWAVVGVQAYRAASTNPGLILGSE